MTGIWKPSGDFLLGDQIHKESKNPVIIMAGIPMVLEQLVYYTNILNLTLRENDESQECHEKSF